MDYVSRHPISADFGRVWNRRLPPVRYRDADNGLSEDPPAGWTSEFPHALRGGRDDKAPGAAFYAQWERSPYADAYIGDMAGALVRSMRLGQRGTTDVLSVSFSTPDLLGHGFGPRSQEMQDIYAHLDRTNGRLLEALDQAVGRDNYVVGLSADHGVMEIPEQILAAGHDGGRTSSAAVANVVEQAASAALGPGRYVARANWNDIYLAPGQYAALAAKPDALAAVLKAVSAIPSVAAVYTSDQLRQGATAEDPLLRAAALSYVPDRSGDIVIALKPGWMFGPAGTTHGSANPYDQMVPLLFYGRAISPGIYTNPATPADLAPTLARIVGITLPSATGRALDVALGRPLAPSPTSGQ
jgi:hypothetical protein